MVLDQMSQNLPIDNVCAMLRMLVALGSEDMKLSEQAIVSLVEILPRYLIDIVHILGSWIEESMSIMPGDPAHYETDNSSRVEVIVSVLLLLHKDNKLWQIMRIHLRQRSTVFCKASSLYSPRRKSA